MNGAAIIDRIEQRLDQLGLSAKAASLAASGSPDLIRNWKRARDLGKPFNIQHGNLAAVARAIDVPLDWLLNTETTPPPLALNDEATSYLPAPAQEQAAKAMFSGHAKHPQILMRMATAMPGLGLQPGDLLITDLGRQAVNGDLVAVTITRNSTTSTAIRRYYAPWLLANDPALDNPCLRDDDANTTIRYPVVGMVRGTLPA